MDLDQMKSVVFDPFKKRRYEVLLPQKNISKGEEETEDEDTDHDEVTIGDSRAASNITLWSHTETLALINIFSLFKEKFKTFKKKKDQWKLISEELAKIGIHKIPQKCEIKWKNLMRVYRQHKIGNKAKGKFEFFNELDHIIANDNRYKYIIQYAPVKAKHIDKVEDNDGTVEQQNCKKTKCRCLKSERQKRHEDRMLIMSRKMELEERKVKAFEDYVQFLKANCRGT